jgi:beta-glucosidase
MDSYNLVNGEHMTQNKVFNTDILKKEWGFHGLLMSDWDATYDGVAAANSGLDLEMPFAKEMNAKALLPALESGAVGEATLDDKVRRLLRVAIQFGFLDRDQTELGVSLDNQHGAQVALEGARESLTLLKNQDGLLPLNSAHVRTIAVIGPDAWPAVTGGGGSSNVTPFGASSLLDGLSDSLTGKVKVLYARGIPSPEEIFSGTDFTELKREVFEGQDATGKSFVTTPSHIDEWKSEMFTPPTQHPETVRYTGVFTPKMDGPYVFLVAASGEDTYELEVDGKTVIDPPHREGQAPRAANLPLHAGHAVHFTLTYHPSSSRLRIGFGIRSEQDLISADARKIAASADAVVLSVGFGPATESEGYDRTFELPWGQDDLIRSISAVNPHTVVVITAGGAVDALPWIQSVPAVLHNYYPGQAGGTALAEVLFGERSPEGRLPFSFDRSWQDDPVHDSYYPATVTSGTGPTVRYAEGLFNGYRYYTSEADGMAKQPLFPFGYGLTYTTFRYSGIKAVVSGNGDATTVMVSLDVTNTGKRAGSDVVQLYVGDPSAKVKRPAKELKGFERVQLEPAATRHLEFKLTAQDLAYYSVEKHGWQVDPGGFKVYAGGDSQHTPQIAAFNVMP